MIIQDNKTAEIFSNYYTKILSDPHMKINLRKYIRMKKQDDQLYNKPITERELKAALKQLKNRATTRNIEVPTRRVK